MNNKGFAITTIIFGTMILFCLLLVSLLGILSTYKNNLEKLIEESQGTRDIITIKRIDACSNDVCGLVNINNIQESGLYCIEEEDDCRYISNAEIKLGL